VASLGAPASCRRLSVDERLARKDAGAPTQGSVAVFLQSEFVSDFGFGFRRSASLFQRPLANWNQRNTLPFVIARNALRFGVEGQNAVNQECISVVPML